MANQEPTKLPKEFFDSLKKYQEIMAMPVDEKFKKFAPTFLGRDLHARAVSINDYLPRLKKTIDCLKNYWSNLTHYETAVDERNWFYKSQEELEKDMKVYKFLCDNYNRRKREVTIKIYTARYNKLVDEYNSIMSIGKNKENTEYLQALPEAFRSMQNAVLMLTAFVANNPEDKYVRIHRLTPEKVNEKYILTKWESLMNLEEGKTPAQPGA